jgi:UDP-N-acetylmuramoyl-L-alanyl-D-glutamate--2,6-diaminopimelate ligase
VLAYSDGARITGYTLAGIGGAVLAARDIETGIFGARFRLDGPFGSRAVTTPMLGEFNIANALCAAGMALAAEVDIADIAAVIAAPPVVSGRMNRVDVGQPFAVVVDYAHTPASLEKVLTLLRRLNPTGRLIAVSGSAGERDVDKRPLQGAVSARLADISIFTNEDPRYEDAAAIIAQIAAGARGAGAVDGVSLYEIVERREAIARAVALAQPGDTILLAGKGHERSIIWNGVKHPWDDAAEARRALQAAGYGHEVRS